MIYGSVCSGVESASVAWELLGWKPAWFCENDKFPSAVLKHHYPDVPNLGDMTTIETKKEYNDRPIDLLVGGTPCQSFSIAGLRQGLDDERGNLAFKFCEILRDKQPRWFVWENVPGVLSNNDGRDFAAILSGFSECGYSCAYRILDSQYYGVPQRRRRIFVIGHLGSWQGAVAVLFEREGLQGHIEPRRKAQKEIATRAGKTIDEIGTFRMTAFGEYVGDDKASTLKQRDHKDATDLIVMPIHDKATRFGGSDKAQRQDGAGNGLGIGKNGDPSPCLTVGDNHAVAFFDKDEKFVRRLMPIECERLQGFPDDWTKIPYNNKPKSKCPDAPRFKAMGNSMTVHVMRWIGERIDLYERVNKHE